MMGSHQMTERQVLDAVIAEAIATVFEEYVDKHGLAEIAEIFGKGVKIEVGDMLPSSHYAERLKRVPPVWDKAFEVNASESDAGAGVVRRVRAGRPVRHRPHLALAEARADHVRDQVSRMGAARSSPTMPAQARASLGADGREHALREEVQVHKALTRIARRLEELRVPYAIAGGMALFSTAIGVHRGRTISW